MQTINFIEHLSESSSHSQEFRGIGSRIAEMEAKVAAAGSSKRYKS